VCGEGCPTASKVAAARRLRELLFVTGGYWRGNLAAFNLNLLRVVAERLRLNGSTLPPPR
jgi:hypothetical protein